MPNRTSIPVLRFSQWLDSWNAYDFDAAEQRRKPEADIYLFSMSATRLRHYSDVYRRERKISVAEGIQRVREDSRTSRIRRYVDAGYPFGDLKSGLQENNKHLRKPGWLPTAIVVNILTEQDERRGIKIDPEHIVRVSEKNGTHRIHLPDYELFDSNDLRPFEVIDGQHRLWAFADDRDIPNFEVPVVAFHGLDVAWQAYLFWSINISPVRINPSHAFDLYPLLRTQEWLLKTGEITVYREARAQEITEWLYKHPESPWLERISMLQRKGEPRVSQAAWVRSLIGSFFSTGRGKGRKGLFQCAYNDTGDILDWERVQQIAFIMEFWHLLQKAILDCDSNWIKLYHEVQKNPFTDRSSMLNQDMGVRAVHAVLNDLFFHAAGEHLLGDWSFGIFDKTVTEEKDIKRAISSLRKSKIYRTLLYTSQAVAGFDWRSLDGPGVRGSEDELLKRAYRGSGGYTMLTNDLLTHMSKFGAKPISSAALAVQAKA